MVIIQEKRDDFSIEEAKTLIERAGEKWSVAWWQDDQVLFGFSVKTVLGTYGEPAVSVRYDKQTKWLIMTGSPENKEKIIS